MIFSDAASIAQQGLTFLQSNTGQQVVKGAEGLLHLGPSGTTSTTPAQGQGQSQGQGQKTGPGPAQPSASAQSDSGALLGGGIFSFFVLLTAGVFVFGRKKPEHKKRRARR